MASVHYLDLPQQYAQMVIPVVNQRDFGTKTVTRLLVFVDHFRVTNEDYDQLMAMKPQRQNGESAEQFKLRSQLRAVMSKYKHLFYNYNVYLPTQKQIKAARKHSLKAV